MDLIHPDYGTFFGEQLVLMVQTAKKHGVSIQRILEETSRALGPVVAGEAAEGFATPEEGRNDLLTREGGTVSLSHAAKLYRQPLGVSRQALTDQIRKGNVIAYQSGKRGYVLPVWQFRPEGGLLPGLEKVLEALRAHPGYGSLLPFTFFLQEHPVTDYRTPLAALRDGKLDQVLTAVAADIR